jgi:hypothetical protein
MGSIVADPMANLLRTQIQLPLLFRIAYDEPLDFVACGSAMPTRPRGWPMV